MKKIIVILLMFLSLSIFSSENDEENKSNIFGGIKFGLGMSSWVGDDSEFNNTNPTYKTVYQLGGFVNIIMNESLSFQLELLLDNKGADYSIKQSRYDEEYEEDYEVKYTLKYKQSYITIPVLLNIKLNKTISFLGGLYLSKLSSASEKLTSGEYNESHSVTKYLNSSDYGFVIGGVFYVDNFVFDFRYNHGLSKLFNDKSEGYLSSDSEIYNRQLILSMGYIF